MNVKDFKPKNPFDEILSLSFDLGPLKVNINALDKSQFCKLNDYQKDLYNKTHFDGKKIKRIKTY